MSFSLPPSDLTALKIAAHDLVKAAGGVERAALLTGRGKSQVARWSAALDDKTGEPCRATIDAASIAALERDLAERGDPRRPVTECLARLGGRALADAVDGRARVTVAKAAARISGEVGRLMTTLVEALADGEVSTTEATLGDAAAREVGEALVHLRQALAQVRGGERGA